ncbi:hypothetical protein MP228_005427 [Amoeboaphelidium protococcarum]|nr:hypothetical protein MP228_005427 [Amoeboaphelidium protococcarum]
MSNLVQQLDSVISGGLKQQKRTQLQTMIDMACDIQHPEPDLGLNLEIVDLINQKQKNLPHEAAMTIVEYVNSRDTHQSMLALSLLDQCVKNCGFPFHLQISTKAFLNEFVRKFPERPPANRTAVQERILEQIQLWNYGIFEVSKYRQDLVHINDMYRLLKRKGYTFPQVRQEAAQLFAGTPSSILSNNALKTRDELENEDRMVQSAKLQELVRRGTPADLAQANELMKVMAGYYHDKIPDYSTQQNEMLESVEGNGKRLLDKLKTIAPGIPAVGVQVALIDNRELQDMLAVVKSGQPKILKLIEDAMAAGDSEGNVNTDRLLYLNDILNEGLRIYDQLKNNQTVDFGKVQSIMLHSNVTSPASVNSQAKQVSQQYQQQKELSLIDMGEDDDILDPLERKTSGGAIQLGKGPTHTQQSAQAQSPPKKSSDPFGELAGLNFGMSNQVPAQNALQDSNNGKQNSQTGQPSQYDSLI